MLKFKEFRNRIPTFPLVHGFCWDIITLQQKLTLIAANAANPANAANDVILDQNSKCVHFGPAV